MEPLLPRADTECDRVLAAARRFVRAAGSRDVEQPWRAHLRDCEACRRSYSEEVELLSQLRRSAVKSLERREELASRASFSAFQNRGRRRPLARMLLPAAGLLAAFAIISPAAGGHVARVDWLRGRVGVGPEELGVEQPNTSLERGELCAVGGAGVVRFRCGPARLWAEEGTAFLYERSSPLRLRLFAGTLMGSGPGVISTTRGVLEMSASSGAIGVQDGFVRIAPTGPGWRWSDAAGSRELTAGELLLLEFVAKH